MNKCLFVAFCQKPFYVKLSGNSDLERHFSCEIEVVKSQNHHLFNASRKVTEIFDEMEVDEEIGQLLQRVSSMQTQDRQDQINQMRRLVGSHLTEEKANFYLEMSNCNVMSAVNFFFDLEAENATEVVSSEAGAVTVQLPQMVFISDVTVGEGESVPPSTNFVKTWTVKNSGSTPWPLGCTLKLASGHAMGGEGVRSVSISVPAVAAGASTNFSVQMTSPSESGIYESQWRLATPTGVFFGDPIWSIVNVDAAGTLALTQQLNAFQAFGGSSMAPNVLNPFTANSVSDPLPPRPSSPTDAHLVDISPRNVLSRFVNSDPSAAMTMAMTSSEPTTTMEDDEEMN